MQELEVIEIKNPTNKDFTHRYNGEPFTIKASETKSFAKPIAYHLAKHLSTRMVCDEVRSKAKKADVENPRHPMHVKVAQLSVYDTHERRIALYEILGDENRVVDLISKYPFKGFIGEMDVYREFVGKQQKSKVAEK